MFKNHTDEKIIELVRQIDVLELPLERRFEGDDELIVSTMESLGLSQNIVGKTLVISLVLREAVARGLQVARKN